MSVRIKFAHLATALMLSAVAVPYGSALAGDAAVLPETRVVSIGKPFDALVSHLEQAIKDKKWRWWRRPARAGVQPHVG